VTVGVVAFLAPVRPDSWDFPLLLHVLGALLLVGSLILAAAALLFAWLGGSASLARLGYRSLLFGVLPSWILMRASAEWIASKEHLTDSNLSWISIGFTTADTGLIVIVVATILAGFAARRAGRAEGSGVGLGRGSAVLVSLLLITYLVTVWAMATKPV
jgi:hypothetical protein